MSNIYYNSYPEQEEFGSEYVQSSLGARVKVYFNYEYDKYCLGVLVRSDIEEPYRTLIKLDDGRYVMDNECIYSYIKKTENLKDFKIGQHVWVKLIGDAKRFKKENESLIQEWKITRIGKKYIYAKKDENACEYAFEKSYLNNNLVWVEKIRSSINYILYATYQGYLDAEKSRELRSEIYNTLQFKNSINELSLGQLLEIHNILNENVSTTYDFYTEDDGGIKKK